MYKTAFLRVAMIGLASVFAGSEVLAQDMIFVNDATKLRNVSSLKAPVENDDFPIFNGGDPVYLALKVTKGVADIGAIAGEKDGARFFRVIVSYYTTNRDFAEIFAIDVPVPQDQLKSKSFSFPLIPETYDLSFPGFEKLMASRILEQRANKLSFKVRLESNARPKSYTVDFFSQSIFFINTSGGFGRYEEWKTRYAEILKQKEAEKLAADKKKAEEKAIEDQKQAELDRAARADYILRCESRRTDPALEKDIKTFLEREGTRTMMKVCFRQPDYEIVRNELGVVLRKTVDTAVLFQLKSNGQYRIRWHSYGYEFLGGGAFNTDVNAWTKQHREGFQFVPESFVMPNKSLIYAGRDYAVDDSRIK